MESTQPNIKILEPEVAQRLFRTAITPGGEVDSSFVKNKQNLGIIYEALYNMLDTSMVCDRLEAPDAENLYRTYKTFRRESGIRIPLPTLSEFKLLLLILASQPVPLLHLAREIVPDIKGNLFTRTRYALPLLRNKQAIQKINKTILHNSFTSIKHAFSKNIVYADWDNIVSEFCSADGSRCELSQYDRADTILKSLYISEQVSRELGKLATKVVNINIDIHYHKPLLNLLVQNGIVKAVTNAQFQSEVFSPLMYIKDFIYYNNSERLLARLKNLCIISQTVHIAKLVEPISEDVLATPDQEDDYIYECNVYAQKVLEKVRVGGVSDQAVIEIFVEIIQLAELLEEERLKINLKKEEEEFRNTIELLKSKDNIVCGLINSAPRIQDKHLLRILKGQAPAVLYSVSPRSDVTENTTIDNVKWERFNSIHLLHTHPTNCGNAVQMAVNHFDISGDDSYLFILENMFKISSVSDQELKQYLAKGYRLYFNEALRKAYWLYLPWYKKMWYYLIGSELNDFIINKIRATRSIRRLRPPLFNALVDCGDTRLKLKKRPSSKAELLNRLKWELDSCWNHRIFPDRDMILKTQESVDFRSINEILENVGRGSGRFAEIIRIEVPDQKPIYAWHDYLQKNGDIIRKEFNSKLKKADENTLSSQATTLRQLRAIIAFMDHGAKHKKLA